MVKTTIIKREKKSKKSSSKKKKITYDTFVNLPRERGYFPGDDPAVYLNFVPAIRVFILQKLRERPHKECELISKLKRYSPDLGYAWNYISSEIEDNEEDYTSRKEAFEKIILGIEVRSRGDNVYWGLTSKLDSV